MKDEWKIGDVYSEELAEQTPAMRKNTMEGLAYSIEHGAYTKPLSKEEIAEKKTKLFELSVQLADLAEKKKLLIAELKKEAKEPTEEYAQTRKEIKFRQEEKSGTLYLVDNQDEKMMYLFNEDCVCVDARPLRKEERQQKIRTLNTAVNGN